jgi:hypothetical protein
MNANFEKQVERILSKAKSLNIRLGKTIDLETIRKIERKEKVIFPESYVVFLTEIENGGIGPYDEIYSLKESLERNKLFESSLNIENPYIEDTDISESEKTQLDESKFQERIGEILGGFFEGSMDICEYGCGDFFRLIVYGKSAGNVWNYSFDDTGLYNLNVDILTFFENWLDREIDMKTNPDKEYPAEYSCLEFGNNHHYKLIEE